MRNQEFVRTGHVELVIKHLAGCACDLETPDPDKTLVQLGCVGGYLVERPDHNQCPNCMSPYRDNRFVMPAAEGTEVCAHEWHDQVRSVTRPTPSDGAR
jgi:hypothetical protein